jgi:hypothetical protein
MRIPWICLPVLLTVGCASEQTRREAGILTIAVAGDTVLIGRSRSFGVDGTFHLRSLETSPLDRKGRFKYHNPPYGRARFNCSNQEAGTIRIQAEGNLQGSGFGDSTLGPVQVVFGYTVAQANRRLELPEGKTLTIHDKGILLEELVSK